MGKDPTNEAPPAGDDGSRLRVSADGEYQPAVQRPPAQRGRHKHALPDPVYLHNVAEAFTSEHAESAQNLARHWGRKFHSVHFERYGTRVPAAVAEVTPRRPPFDYRHQRPRRHLLRQLFKRKRAAQAPGRDAPELDEELEWAYLREALVTYPVDAKYTELNDLFSGLSTLYLRSSNYTDAEDAVFCHRIIRDAMSECVCYYDQWDQEGTSTSSSPSQDHALTLGHLERRFREAEGIYRRCAERRTVTQYSVGMVFGVLAVPLFMLINHGAFRLYEVFFTEYQMDPRLVIGVHVGCALGAVGAVLSVLLRISGATTRLDVESTRHGWHFWMNPAVQRGAVRVILGTLFGGMVAWFLLAGFLVPDTFELEAGGTESTVLTIGVLAFLSGFSERFIPDMVVKYAPGDRRQDKTGSASPAEGSLHGASASA